MCKTSSQLAILACILHSIHPFPAYGCSWSACEVCLLVRVFFFLGAKKEIEEELRATQSEVSTEKPVPAAQQIFPLHTLISEKLNAVTTSTDFVAFVERSSKIIKQVFGHKIFFAWSLDAVSQHLPLLVRR